MSERREDPRVEELLRVNAELAAEVRNLTLGYADAPRPAGMPTTRRLGRLIEERDQLQAELEAARAELQEVRADRAGLERQNQEMASEIARLSSGLSGFLRRARGRFLSRGS
jgi:chromosome segregation ATPase